MATNPVSPTIHDVAHEAGVSPATVSRVLNQTAPVNEQTRQRVLNAIAALGYTLPTSADSPRIRTRTIALLITDILNPFFPEIVRGVEQELRPAKQALMLCNTSEDAERERQILHMLTERSNIDGVILCASRVSVQNIIALREQHGLPIVVINRRLDHPAIPCIIVDFANAAGKAAQHLLNLNHTRIAYLAGSPASESSQARRRGIEATLHKAGLALPEELIVSSFPGLEGGFQAMSALLELPEVRRPTAVIAYNDLVAIGALHAIRVHGLSVPQDISVVGFDGITLAAHTNPPLTTIDVPKLQMGTLAMQILNKLLDGEVIQSGGYTLMESPLVVRESTALLK